MRKLFAFILSVLFILTMAIPVFAQQEKPIHVRQVIEKRLSEDGFYLGNPGFIDGLRYVEKLPDNQIVIWGLGDFRFNDYGQLILPLDNLTRQYVDLSDPALRVIVGDHNKLIGQLADSCLATGYPEKYMKDDAIFWLLQGKKKQP
ncbi:MAG: hypothetical protein WC528_02280 [Patescibacteria group bacterium]